MSGFTGLLAPILLASIPAPGTIPLPPGPLPEVAAWLAATGLLGMGLRGIFGGDDDDPDEEAPADEDFLGTIDADGSMDEGFDGFDEPLDGDEDPLAEVEPRMDDLEAELADLASTVSAVRGEHESIRESVEEVEENVRKLLEVYEVVTQGANPFADAPPQAAGGGGSFGLLEAGGGPAGDDTPEQAGDGLFEADAAPASEDDSEDEDEAATAAEESDGGTEADDGLSFEDLKSEFEFVGEDDEGSEPTLDEPEPEAPDRADPPEPDPAPAEPRDDPPARPDEGRAKPYLRALPDGFGAELLVMEWLDFLVSASSVADAMRAIGYYRSVGWITEDVAARLQTVLSGATAGRDRAATDGGLPGELAVDHHTRSLEYITRIDGLAGNTRRPEPPAGTRTDRRARREGRGVQR